MRTLAAVGSLLGFLAVALGAFGAHALRERVGADLLAIYQTGVQYQAMHAVALLALGLAAPDSKPTRSAGWFMVAGVVVFSGSLYALSITGVRGFGAITPIGGVCFLIAWAMLFWSFASRQGSR